MSDAETRLEHGKSADLHASRSAPPTTRKTRKTRIRIIPLLITLATTGLAAVLGWAMWEAYMGAPWTRDALTFAQEQAARYRDLAVKNAGTVQMEQQTASQLRQAQAALQNAQATLALAERQIESLKAQLAGAEASVAQATAQRNQAQVNL